MSKIFDSHAHYDDQAFDVDRNELLNNLFSSDVCNVINVGCNIETDSSVESCHGEDLLSVSYQVLSEASTAAELVEPCTAVLRM